MAESRFEELISVVRFGSTFESLRAGTTLAWLLRKERPKEQPMKTSIPRPLYPVSDDDGFEELIRTVKSGTLIESLRAAKKISDISRGQRPANIRFDDEEVVDEMNFAFPRD